MSTAAQPTTAPATPGQPRRRPGFHLFPYAGTYRYTLIARFLPLLWPAVEKWAATALPISPFYAERSGRTTYEREDLASTLKAFDEWDGFLLAEGLTTFGWQCDAALVAILHRWSCDTHSALCRATTRKPDSA